MQYANRKKLSLIKKKEKIMKNLKEKVKQLIFGQGSFNNQGDVVYLKNIDIKTVDDDSDDYDVMINGEYILSYESLVDEYYEPKEIVSYDDVEYNLEMLGDIYFAITEEIKTQLKNK